MTVISADLCLVVDYLSNMSVQHRGMCPRPMSFRSYVAQVLQ